MEFWEGFMWLGKFSLRGNMEKDSRRSEPSGYSWQAWFRHREQRTQRPQGRRVPDTLEKSQESQYGWTVLNIRQHGRE